MAKILKVILWGEEIGRLAWDVHRHLSYFVYNPDFVRKGLNISPLVAPIDGVRALAPVWGEDAKIYQKLPAFVADSLPDAWGNQLFELWRQQNHLANADITPLDKLSFIGKRGMGALEFEPELSRERKAGKIDMKSLADLAALGKRKCAYLARRIHYDAIIIDGWNFCWRPSAKSHHCH